ncbi:hypothetical protein [Comamonas sp. GB3 AK4-5]|uniref:hypothetical protein n=1 Tax=Comamonas sp. GB3 AK4-5 TaxID=3231487 RepID=UPI00351F3FDA
MNTPKSWRPWRLAALLTLFALQACSTTSAPPPPTTPKLQVTPLPAEISQIDTKSSQSWLERAEQWLQDLQAWSGSGMPK